MNRNPPIMRLRLHWLRYDLVVPPSQPRACTTPHHPRAASPRPGLVSSMPYTCAHVCSRVHRVNVAYTLRTPTCCTCVARIRPSQRGTADARQIVSPMVNTRRCRSPARLGDLFLARAREKGTRRCSKIRRFEFSSSFFLLSFLSLFGRAGEGFFSRHADLGLVNI